MTDSMEYPDHELGFDDVEAIGLDGTGRDGDERFPYTWANLTEPERDMLSAWLRMDDYQREQCWQRSHEALSAAAATDLEAA